MAVRVFSNNLPNPTVRAQVQEAVLEAIGIPIGDWLVQIHEKQESPSWYITIWGPNNFHWSREFFGVEEQNPIGGYSAIREAILEALSRTRLIVYISYAYPDNANGFVNQLRDRLAEELQVQTGQPTEVLWDMDRTGPRGMVAEEARTLVKRATVLLTLVSPSYFNSDACHKEFQLFAEREPRAGRSLIFPVYFVTTEAFENAAAQPHQAWVQDLRKRQYIDLRKNRFDLTSARALQAITLLSKSIRDAYIRFPPNELNVSVVGSNEAIGAEEPIYIESLRLENFGCFEHLDLHFNRPSSLEGRWTCIAGINGSGKSTILQALGVALLGNPLALELGGSG